MAVQSYTGFLILKRNFLGTWYLWFKILLALINQYYENKTILDLKKVRKLCNVISAHTILYYYIVFKLVKSVYCCTSTIRIYKSDVNFSEVTPNFVRATPPFMYKKYLLFTLPHVQYIFS